MKKLTVQLARSVLLTTLIAVVTSGCVSYYKVPQMSAEANLTLTRADIDVVGQANSSEWAFGIFPFNLVAPAPQRAIMYASGGAIRATYENGGADFVLEPQTKITYMNFLIFDYATAEVRGKAIRIK